MHVINCPGGIFSVIRVRRLLQLAFVVGLLAVGGARNHAAAQQTVVWDHSNCLATMDPANPACTPVFNLTAEPGEKITVTIKNTCPTLFDYTVVPVPLPGASSALVANQCTETKSVDITHDPQYGGYIVNVVKKSGSPPVGSARITVAVQTSQFILAFGGGFTVNGLVDPSYVLRAQPSTTSSSPSGGTAAATQYKITEQGDREDKVGHSVVSFVHLTHTRLKTGPVNYGLSFGLGLEPDRTGDYYPGLSLLFGDRAALTIGAIVGNVATLPAGRQIDDIVTDANTLANLGHRRTGSWFVGLSYRFLGNGQTDFKKPFAGQNPPSGTSGGAATGSSTGAAQNTKAQQSAPGASTQSVSLKAGESKPLQITQAAPNAIVTWSIEQNSTDFVLSTASGKTDANGSATVTVTAAANAALGATASVIARVCTVSGDCSQPATYRLTIGN